MGDDAKMDAIEGESFPMEERKHHATRARVEQLISEGWSIIGREPLLLARGSAKLEVRSNGIIVQG